VEARGDVPREEQKLVRQRVEGDLLHVRKRVARGEHGNDALAPDPSVRELAADVREKGERDVDRPRA
jgi:hypothetical protein